MIYRRAGATRIAALAIGLLISLSKSAGAQRDSSAQTSGSFSIPVFIAGAATSLAAHEASHLLTSLAMGGHPSLGFNQFRPVIHSGIDTVNHPMRQFAFSAAGMTTQLLLNEVILDAPHSAGPAGSFEKGLLASGVGTVVFYFTIGREASISDVSQMSANGGISKWTLTAMFGSVAVLDAVRILTRQRYAHFFASPMSDGVAAGVEIRF